MSTTKLPDTCPFCAAAVTTMSNGKLCRSDEGLWVAFECLTSIHAGQDQRTCQSRPCEAAERTRLTTEVDTLRTANAALVERVHAAELILTDPHALWANWLRGTVQLPAGIGDIRQSKRRAKRMEEAVDLAIKTLEMVKTNVEHEIRQREGMGRSANQWPDVLTGWVSGGGIISTIESLNAAKKGQV